jgi:hypothetical protein
MSFSPSFAHLQTCVEAHIPEAVIPILLVSRSDASDHDVQHYHAHFYDYCSGPNNGRKRVPLKS